MNTESQLLFFFSAIGAFNGFILAFYFFYTAYTKKFSNYFLGCLLFVISTRIVKSVFFYFNDDLNTIFIQIGLSGCILIGPFLYLYFKKHFTNELTNWAIHVFPYIIGITILGTVYPYTSNLDLWRNWIIRGIYLQWFLYIVFSFLYIKDIVKVPFSQNRKVKKIDLWILSVYFGVVTIFLAYYTSSYTSYIVGALSFSFVLYLIILLLIFKKGKNNSFFEEKTRYESKKLDSETVLEIEQKILLIAENELYLNPQLTLLDTAKELNISSHILSQVLNEKFNKSFTSYINELRIKKAKTLLITNKNLTIEGIGYESGFNSKSSFFTHFKKITNQTPSEFQKFGVYSSDL